jgi:glutamyl-tRNA synthetase
LKAEKQFGVRFAPSPTGRFHVGNLRSAWISKKAAEILGEPWTVRFEDIDKPRVVQGAMEEQLADLKALGLTPDEIQIQSSRHDRHFNLFLEAITEGAVYPCTCSRREVQEALGQLASAPHSEIPLYSGHCRVKSDHAAEREEKKGDIAWRFRREDPKGCQDFIVARTGTFNPTALDFTPSYHWACAIDDYDGRYRLLVRASDLVTSAPLQRSIQKWISFRENRIFTPQALFHTALVVQNGGERLEKRTRGVTLPELLSSGLSLDQILSKFQTSFHFDFKTLRAGEIFSETEEIRTLSSLGFQ